MKKTLTVDVAIIGSGTAGLSAYRAAKLKTPNVVMIEGGQYGTTCARVGCMPSKLLIAAAERAHQVETSEKFGISYNGEHQIDGRQIMGHLKSERDRFVGFVIEGVNAIPEQDRLVGHARFVDQHTIKIDDDITVNAERIVIATGSRPSYPPAWNKLGSKVIVNDDVFEWDELPKSVAVFGPGVIGLELGQALHRLGVDVRVFGMGGKVGPLSDPKVTECAIEVFKSEFYLDVNADVKSIELSEDGSAVEVTHINLNGEVETFTCDYLLAATGRRPNIDTLDIQNTDIALDERGVPIANPSTMQTSVPNIFIAGDASNQLPLLHEAADQGFIAGTNAGSFPDIESGLRRSAIGVVFSDPQIGTVGQTHHQLTNQYHGNFAVGEMSYVSQGRSRVMQQNKGLMRVYGEFGSNKFLGAEFFGPASEHIAHLLAWAHQQNMTVPEMLDMPFYHPVIEEGLRTALRDLNETLRSCNCPKEDCSNCTPGC
ncbi:dihydrolipoyl dehydrogenase [Vibrio comitans]|uniref:Dihydrolipoyl dehydrogenase n=1 Tax=Vibrio comitans NBRC 102076 TaxID=1219078 RepID=A0A4Y3IPC8_9VIBR|nr:dihydrolipoyl dehydrogenase [Vibrio comitans]GEA61226.1 dihydrolipoyl dehydrogenase [Vibrio comitans NBRC 102076]